MTTGMEIFFARRPNKIGFMPIHWKGWLAYLLTAAAVLGVGYGADLLAPKLPAPIADWAFAAGLPVFVPVLVWFARRHSAVVPATGEAEPS